MSAGTRLPFREAYQLAQALCGDLRPHVKRLEVVGSIRRQRRTVGDVEILAEPHLVPVDLFGVKGPELDPIKMLAATWGHVEKAGDRFIQVRDVRGTGVTCDLWLVHPPAEWGPLLAIRTGPRELSTAAVTNLRRHGLCSTGGHIERLDPYGAATGEVVPCPTEEEFFRLAGLRCVPPPLRDGGAPLRARRREAF